MNTPTQAQRNKIDSAIDKVASLCTEDPTITPSEAIAKVASAMQLTQDYLPIIVRAYNTGAAAIHRENSNTLQEKVASYPIADIDKVYSILLQENPLNKTASAEPVKDDFWKFNADHYWPDAWDYLKKEPDFSDWRRPQVKMAKCTDYKDKVDRNATKTIEMIADEASRVKQAAIIKRDQALDNVEYELCKYAGVDLNDARRYAELAYGQEGVNVVNKIIKDNRLEKKARVKSFLDDNHPFAKAFEEFVDNNEQVKKATIQERQILEACVDALGETVQPKDKYIEGMGEIDQLFKEAELHHKKKSFLKQAYTPISADPHTGMTGLELMNHPGWGGLDRFERELMYSLADPAQEAELRKIRVQTILVDLMNTDPYLKDKNPEEVVNAVNEILEVNPDLHNNKPMLRIALRQYLESGGMDIPTLGLVSEYGKEERERRAKEKADRAERGLQAGRDLHQRLTDSERDTEEREYREGKDRAEAERWKAEQDWRKSESKKDREFQKEEFENRKEQSEADRKSRENMASQDRAQRQQQWQRDLLHKQDQLWWDRERYRRDEVNRTNPDYLQNKLDLNVEERRNENQKEMERRRTLYQRDLARYQDARRIERETNQDRQDQLADVFRDRYGVTYRTVTEYPDPNNDIYFGRPTH